MKLKNLLILMTALMLSLTVMVACTAAGSGGDDGGSVGDDCEIKSDCADGLACLSSTNQCVQTCEDDSDCDGDTCIAVTGGGYCSFSGSSSNNTSSNNTSSNNSSPNNSSPNNSSPNNSSPNNSTPAGDSCSDAYECLANCQDQACADECVAGATPAAQQDLSDMLTCFDASCADETTNEGFQTCALANCEGEVNACLGGGGTGATGNATCDESYNCLANCQDAACQQECFDGGTAQAQQDLSGMLTCFNDFCADETTDQGFQDCAFANCDAEINACFGGGNGGGGGTACLQDCAADGDCGAGEVCVDVTGQGNMQCVIEQNGQLGVPADFMECDANGGCPTGETCYQLQ